MTLLSSYRCLDVCRRRLVGSSAIIDDDHAKRRVLMHKSIIDKSQHIEHDYNANMINPSALLRVAWRIVPTKVLYA